ncbi:MAG TPA: GNAT family N-acetyltransferase [Thermoplasmata archaeon]
MVAADMSRVQAAVAIRDFQSEDYPAVVEISNLLFPDDPGTVEEAKWDDKHWDADRYVRRKYVAVEPGGAVVGRASFNHIPVAFHPQRFAIWVAVHPEWQRQGIGSVLHDHLLNELRRLDAVALRTWVKESMSETAGWVARRGFKELTRAWESRLDLAAFDRDCFADHWGLPRDIEITSLAEELERSPNALRDMYDLDNAVAPDMPRIDPHTPMSFEMVRDWVLNSPGSEPRAIFFAKAGDCYVALTVLFKSEAQPDVLFTGTTGVLRDYRRRGIAFAIKLRSLEWAKRNGFREVRTWNNTLNEAMLAINVKLGFAKQPPWITFGKDLTRE